MTSKLRPTPLPEPTRLDRLATAASEFPNACWLWIPLTTGAVIWPWLGPVLTPIAMLGGWWRVICLRQAIRGSRWLRSSWLPRIWATYAFAWSSLGVAASVAVLLPSLGLEPGLAPHGLLQAWRLATVAEMGLAILWVMREASIRESGWVWLMMTFAAILGVICLGVQWLIHANPAILEGSRLAIFGLFAVLLGAGSVAPLLIADGVGRVLTSEADEVLDPPSP